jgi:hypothetical protein
VQNLAKQFDVGNPVVYVALAASVAFLTRLLLVALRGFSLAHGYLLAQTTHSNFWLVYRTMVWRSFRGWHHPPNKEYSDYWYTYLIGLFELIAYPILIRMEAWEVIGAWIGLRVLSQWGIWQVNRAVFNLFLIGTLTNLGFAYFWLSPLVTIRS